MIVPVFNRDGDIATLLMWDIDRRQFTDLDSAQQYPDQVWTMVLDVDFTDGGLLECVSEEFWDWLPDW